ncbi:MAG: hypothetical protein ACLGHG_07940 [Gammaproteobacteria bacterium]
MTPFLVATLAALIVGGTLVVVYREKRRYFVPALLATVLVAAAVAGYVLWVGAGGSKQGDPSLVVLETSALEEVAGSYRLTGRLVNRSSTQAITAVPLRLLVEDCSGDDCRLQHDLADTLLVSIPPGEARDFVRVFPVSRRPASAALKWRVETGAPQVYEAVIR